MITLMLCSIYVLQVLAFWLWLDSTKHYFDRGNRYFDLNKKDTLFILENEIGVITEQARWEKLKMVGILCYQATLILSTFISA